MTNAIYTENVTGSVAVHCAGTQLNHIVMFNQLGRSLACGIAK